MLNQRQKSYSMKDFMIIIFSRSKMLKEFIERRLLISFWMYRIKGYANKSMGKVLKAKKLLMNATILNRNRNLWDFIR
jgi:hypothetical protein